MQGLQRRTSTPSLGRGDRAHRCHECGEPIRGFEATGEGHRFVGCGHPAEAHFVRDPAAARTTCLGISSD